MAYDVTRLHAVESIIDDNCGITKFYAIAHALSEDLEVVFLDKQDDGNTMDWDFLYRKTLLTLHFDVYGGVSLIQADEEESPVVRELAEWLHRHAY